MNVAFFQLKDWWLNIAYLEFRSPTAIHVNPGLLFPSQTFSDQRGQLRLVTLYPTIENIFSTSKSYASYRYKCFLSNSISFRYAAQLVEGILDYKIMVDE